MLSDISFQGLFIVARQYFSSQVSFPSGGFVYSGQGLGDGDQFAWFEVPFFFCLFFVMFFFLFFFFFVCSALCIFLETERFSHRLLICLHQAHTIRACQFFFYSAKLFMKFFFFIILNDFFHRVYIKTLCVLYT